MTKFDDVNRAVHKLKMTTINKRDKKLKLLPLLNESIYSSEIFSEHLWLLLRSKNSYLSYMSKLMTSSGSFQLTGNTKKYFYAFDQCVRQFLDEMISKLPINESRIEKLLLVNFLFSFLFSQIVEK